MGAVLDKFIERYVLCEKCRYPEVDMKAKKGFVQGSCKACGWCGDLDNDHKLATFILKNPPNGGGFGDDQRKLDKKARQQMKAEKQRKSAAEETVSDVSEEKAEK